MMWPVPMMADATSSATGDEAKRKARAGDGENGGAEPGGLGVVAAIDLAADADRDQDRADREGGGDQAEPDDRQVELDGAVGRGDADHRRDQLHQHGADEQRHEQAVVGIAGAETGGELFEHRSVRLAYDARPSRNGAAARSRKSRAAGRPTSRGRSAGRTGRRHRGAAGRRRRRPSATQYSIFQVQVDLQSRQQASEFQTEAARLPCG